MGTLSIRVHGFVPAPPSRLPLTRRQLALLCLSCSLASSAAAQSIHAYKSVHTDGSVTYSDTRPLGEAPVQQVNLYQDSGAIEQQGQQRLQQMDAAARELEERRAAELKAARERESEVAQAQKEVADAERFLLSVEQSKKNANSERISAAREHLRLARQRLREVQSGAR